MIMGESNTNTRTELVELREPEQAQPETAPRLVNPPAPVPESPLTPEAKNEAGRKDG